MIEKIMDVKVGIYVYFMLPLKYLSCFNSEWLDYVLNKRFEEHSVYINLLHLLLKANVVECKSYVIKVLVEINYFSVDDMYGLLLE